MHLSIHAVTLGCRALERRNLRSTEVVRGADGPGISREHTTIAAAPIVERCQDVRFSHNQ